MKTETQSHVGTDELNVIKAAPTVHSVLEVIRNRWSPRGLSSEPLPDPVIRSILEAGSWAASAFNEQPWRFIIGLNFDETHAKLVSALDPFNQAWASKAPMLLLAVGKKHYSHNQTPNRHYMYDLGQSVAYMTLQAIEHQVYCHQMAGFDPVKAAELFQIDTSEYDPLVTVAFAYRGSLDHLNDSLRQREHAPRTRKSLSEIVFHGQWNKGIDSH